MGWNLLGVAAEAPRRFAGGRLLVDVPPVEADGAAFVFGVGQPVQIGHAVGRRLLVRADVEVSGAAAGVSAVIQLLGPDGDDHGVEGLPTGDPTPDGEHLLEGAIDVPEGATLAWVAVVARGAARLSLGTLRATVVGPGTAEADLPLEEPGWETFRLATTPPGDDVRAQLRAALLPLDGVEPGARRQDLSAFVEHARTAVVVGLGEATHGTSEHFRAKHRLIEALVLDAGCRLVAMEANVACTLAVDRWVCGGPGRAEDVVAGMHFWTWDTEEVVALVRWLRDHNDGRPEEERVHLVGVDAQMPTDPVRWLLRTLARSDPAAARRCAEQLRPLLSGTTSDLVDEGTALVALEALGVALEEHGHDRVVALVLSSARAAVVQRRDWMRRDLAMAECCIAWHELLGGGPAALWAHDGHVGRYASVLGRSAGAHLHERLGDGYVPVLLTLGGGSFRAMADGAMARHELPPPGPASFEAALADGPPVAMLDLRVDREPLRSWLRSGLEVTTVGSTWEQPKGARPRARIDLPREADWALHVRDTTPSVPTRTGDRPRTPVAEPLAGLPPLSRHGAAGWREVRRSTTAVRLEVVDGSLHLSAQDPAVPHADAGITCRLDTTARGGDVTVTATVDARPDDPFAPTVLLLAAPDGPRAHATALGEGRFELTASVAVDEVDALDVSLVVAGSGSLTIRSLHEAG